MIDRYPTKTETRKRAKEYATSLNKLINPDDVQDDADSWAEVDNQEIERECAESAGIITSEHDEMRHLIKDTAFRLWMESMRRVSRDVLGDAPDRELVRVYGIQPNDMDKYELHDICHAVYEEPNARIPYGYVDEAREVVEDGLMEGTKPEV